MPRSTSSWALRAAPQNIAESASSPHRSRPGLGPDDYSEIACSPRGGISYFVKFKVHEKGQRSKIKEGQHH